MLLNYLKIAWRNIIRNKTYAGICIAGIGIGITAFWFIALFVGDELTYDRFHEKKHRIFRVAQHTRWEGGNINLASTSGPFAASLKETYPEIEQATRLVMEGDGVIRYQDKTIEVPDIFFADANVFDVFTFPILYGQPKTALSGPQAIVLSESLARKLFGDPKAALHQTIYFENNFPNTVTGIMKDVPENSHIRFSALRSMPDYKGEWQQFNVFTYLLLKEGTNYQKLESRLPQWAAGNIQAIMRVDDYRLELQPLTRIYLHSNLQVEAGRNGSITRVYVFSGIAILVLIIALINYMNLATARASVRVREVGIRKVIGSGKKDLVSLFITEAVLLTFLASLAALFLVSALLPWFNALSGKHVSVWRFGTLPTLLMLAGFVLLTGVISGIYPALFLSRFKTIPALKGQLGNLAASILFRKSLVVFQFVVTVVMIISSLVIYKQLKYAEDKDLGFNKEQVLTFHIHDRQVRSQAAAIKEQLMRSPLIHGVSVAGNPIGNNDLGSMGFRFEKNDGTISTSSKLAQELLVDADYLPTMDIRLVQGRNFSTAGQADKYSAALVNETLVKELGWKDPIGKRISFRFGKNETGERTVVGVIKDFHTYSLQHKVEAMVLMMPPVASLEDNLYVKINTAKTAEALAFIGNVYKKFDPHNPLSVRFLDENFAAQYAAESKQEQLALAFTLLAVVIACLGLFGLAAFTAQQRVKEIGIRKVLGASAMSITVMLSKDFVKLVAIACCIAVPLALFAMHRWLEGFAYRIDLTAGVFVIGGMVAATTAILTVSIQAMRAALANPVDSLRSE